MKRVLSTKAPKTCYKKKVQLKILKNKALSFPSSSTSHCTDCHVLPHTSTDPREGVQKC